MDRNSIAVDGAARLGMLDGLIGYHMRRASAVLGADFARAVAGTGMRQVLVGILSIVEANPGINQGSVGKALGIQRANMVSLVNELADAGLVERRPGQSDRRALALYLSPAGEETLARMRAAASAHEAALLAALTEAERATLLALLRRIEPLAPAV